MFHPSPYQKQCILHQSVCIETAIRENYIISVLPYGPSQCYPPPFPSRRSQSFSDIRHMVQVSAIHHHFCAVFMICWWCVHCNSFGLVGACLVTLPPCFYYQYICYLPTKKNDFFICYKKINLSLDLLLSNMQTKYFI